MNLVGERRHEWFHKLDVGFVGVKLKIKRIGSSENLTVDLGVTAIALRKVTTQHNASVLAVEMALDFGITHGCSVIVQVLDVQLGRRAQSWCSREDVGNNHIASCHSTKVHMIDFQSLEDVIEMYVLERDIEFVVGITRHTPGNLDELVVAASFKVVHFKSATFIFQTTLSHLPHCVVKHHLGGIDINGSLELAIAVAPK